MELCDIIIRSPPQDLSPNTCLLGDVQISQNGKVALFHRFIRLPHGESTLQIEVWDVSTSTRRYVYYEEFDPAKYNDAKLVEDGRLLSLYGPEGFKLVDTKEQTRDFELVLLFGIV